MENFGKVVGADVGAGIKVGNGGRNL